MSHSYMVMSSSLVRVLGKSISWQWYGLIFGLCWRLLEGLWICFFSSSLKFTTEFWAFKSCLFHYKRCFTLLKFWFYRFCESKPSSSYPRKFLGCFIQQSSRSLTCSITVKVLVFCLFFFCLFVWILVFKNLKLLYVLQLCIFNDMVRVQSTAIATVSRVQIPSRLR